MCKISRQSVKRFSWSGGYQICIFLDIFIKLLNYNSYRPKICCRSLSYLSIKNKKKLSSSVMRSGFYATISVFFFVYRYLHHQTTPHLQMYTVEFCWIFWKACIYYSQEVIWRYTKDILLLPNDNIWKKVCNISAAPHQHRNRQLFFNEI